MKKCVGGLIGLLLAGQALALVEVPGMCAYTAPDPDRGVDRGRGGALSRWEEKTTLAWYGRIAKAGELELSVKVPAGQEKNGKLELTISLQADPKKSVKRKGEPGEGKISFGKVPAGTVGYYKFELAGAGARLPDIEALVVDGTASEEAHFSTVERRNSASVHLAYEVPQQVKDEVEWCYLEVTPKTDPLWTYYEATGWHRGYFGMQVNSPTERRIIFSVWDSGDEATHRSKVGEDDRVKLLGKGPEVDAGDFGNEGTGGHSHLVYNWKLGDTVQFLMQAQVDGDHTIYTGWFRDSKSRDWRLVSSFRAPKDGKYLHGLYSFNENFGGQNGDQRRVCEFGNGWIRTHGGEWLPLNQAKFTHDGHGEKERLDRSAGVTGKRFYLANGGFIDDANKDAVTKAYGPLAVPASEGKPPTAAELEKLPRPGK